MAMEYLTKKTPQVTAEEEEQKVTKKDRKAKDPKSVVRQAIGKPLSRSKAQTAWNREVAECIHEEEYLRHRAGKGHFWYTCLQCGGRWERHHSQASKLNSGDRDNGPGGELSKVFACTEKPPRPQDAEGDGPPDTQSCDRKAKRVTWKDLTEAGIGENDRSDVGPKVKNSDSGPKSCSRSPARGLHVGRQRYGRSGHGDSGRRIHSRGDRHDECRLAAGDGGSSDGLGRGIRLSHGEGAHPGSLKLDDLECFESFEAHRTKSHDDQAVTTIRAELKHSAQISDCGLASKVASVAKMAAILLLTFTSTCEATWSLPGIQSFVQVPHWLGEAQQVFFRDQNEWLPLSTEAKLKGKEFHVGLIYPLNSCNHNLFVEDMQWSCKGVSLPRGVKIFLNQSLSNHFGTDIMEIYSVPRVTLEAKLQKQTRPQASMESRSGI